MGYEAALRLYQIAEKGGLLGDPTIRDLILCVSVFDDPEMEKDVGQYIGCLALENMMRNHRTAPRHRPGAQYAAAVP
jgi:hypothetical protein